MFKRRRKAATESDRLDRIADGPDVPADALEPREPPIAAAEEPDEGAPAGSMEKVSSLRQNVTQRLETDPELSKPAPGTIGRLRSRLLRERPDPLLIGAAGVVVLVLGLALIPVILHRSHGRTATTQVAAIPSTPEPPTPSPTIVAARPRAAVTAVLSAASPATPAPSSTAAQPSATPPVMRAANSAAFVPPPSPAPAVPAPQQAAAVPPPGSPALSDLVTSAASRSAIPPPAGAAQPAPAGAGVAAVPPPAAATPADLGPALGNAASQAQRAAALASERSQSAGFAPATSSPPAPAR